MWKFHDFSITQILRGIKFEYSGNAKSAIVKHLEAMNFEFHELLQLMKAAIYQIDKIQSPKIAKIAG